jgi:phosphate transport system ATP-binding protein
MEFETKIETLNLNLYYGDFLALKDVNIKIPAQNITAIIGPSGCGKSTLLRCFNRMNDIVENVKIKGKIIIENKNILEPDTDLIGLRRKIGMVFQRPNVFDLSIYQNLRFGLCIHQMLDGKDEVMEAIQKGLESVGLWEELKDKLKKNARSLSLEQQQRLCIARVLILKPDIILLDEPCSALDPIATLRIEELLRRVLRKKYALVIVTHNMQQAARVSDYAGFMYLGQMIEFEETEEIFTNPQDKLTENYISGRFG